MARFRSESCLMQGSFLCSRPRLLPCPVPTDAAPNPPCPLPQPVRPSGEQQTLRGADRPDRVLWPAGGGQVPDRQPPGQQLPGRGGQRALCEALRHPHDPQPQVGTHDKSLGACYPDPRAGPSRARSGDHPLPTAYLDWRPSRNWRPRCPSANPLPGSLLLMLDLGPHIAPL